MHVWCRVGIFGGIELCLDIALQVGIAAACGGAGDFKRAMHAAMVQRAPQLAPAWSA
jgi:hypothetical protein